MIIEFEKEKLKELEFLKNEISLAFRSKNYFEKMFPFYKFRISILKDNNKDNNTNDTNKNILIYPLDSNVGNVCLPEKESNDSYYYCYFLL